MDEAAYFPAQKEAPIMGKGFPDLAEIEKNHRTRKDGMSRIKSFPGSENKDNYAIRQHEIFVGKKDQRFNYTGDLSAQIGITSVAGMEYGELDPEVLMSQFRFIGVADDEWSYNGENMYNTESLDHGFPVQLAGKRTINNTSGGNIGSGDYIAWRFPATRYGDPGSQKLGYDFRSSINTGVNTYVSRNRAGTPFDKPVIQIEKFNPLDFTFQLSAAFWAFNNPVTSGGISDMLMDEYLRDPNQFTMVQQEAFSWSLAIRTMIVLNETNDKARKDKAVELGLLKDTVNATEAGQITTKALELFKEIFRRNTLPGANDNVKHKGGNWNSPKKADKLDFLYDNVMHYATGGTSVAMMSKLERVIGKACSSAGPSKSLDIMLMGARIGI
jgi:hypothetical protein